MQSFAHQLLAIQTPALEPRSAAPTAPSAATQNHRNHNNNNNQQQQQQRSLEAPRAYASAANNNNAAKDRSSAAAASSTQHIPCKFFRSGQCQAGDKCSFSHTTEQTASPLYCKYYAKGHCKFGNKCALPHINDQRPTSAPASSTAANTNNPPLSLSMTQLNSRNNTPSPSTARSSFSFQHQLQHHLYQDDDPHAFYDGATTPTPTTPLPVPASPNANSTRSLAAAGLSSSASLSHRMAAPGGMVGSPGAHLSSSFGPGSLDSMPSVPANTPMDHHHLLEHYQQQQHMAHLQHQQQQQQQQQQLAHSHGSAAGFLHARRERAMSLRRQSSMLGFDASAGGGGATHLSGSLPTNGAGWASMSPSSAASTTPTPLGQLAAAAQQRASIMSTSSYGTSPVSGGNVWQGGFGSSYDPPAPHLASGSLPRASMMGGGGGGAGMPGVNGGAPRSRLSASFLPGAAPASVPSRLSFSALGGGAGPYYGAESDDYSEPGFDVAGMGGSASYMGVGASSMSGHFGHSTTSNNHNNTGSRLSSLSDDYDAHSFHSGGGAGDQLDDDDTVSAGILPASLSDLLTPIEQRRFASQRTAHPVSSAPGSGFARLGGVSAHAAHAPGTTVHGFNVRPMSTASSSSETTSPTNDIRKSDSAVAFDEDVVFAMQDLEAALPGAGHAAAAATTSNQTMTPSTSSSTVGTSNATSSGQSTPWSHMHTLSALTGATANGSGHSSPAQPTSRRPSGPSPWTAPVASPKGLPVLCADHLRHGQCSGGCGKVHGLQCPVCGLHLLHPMAPHEEHHRHIQECLAAPLNGGAGSAADQMMRGQQQQMHHADMWRS